MNPGGVFPRTLLLWSPVVLTSCIIVLTNSPRTPDGQTRPSPIRHLRPRPQRLLPQTSNPTLTLTLTFYPYPYPYPYLLPLPLPLPFTPTLTLTLTFYPYH